MNGIAQILQNCKSKISYLNCLNHIKYNETLNRLNQPVIKETGFAFFAVFVLPLFVPWLFDEPENRVHVLTPFPFVCTSLYLLTVFSQVYTWAEYEQKLHPLNGAACFSRLLMIVCMWEIVFLICVGHSFLASLSIHSFLIVCQIVGFLTSLIAFYDMMPFMPTNFKTRTNAEISLNTPNLFMFVLSKIRIFFLGKHLVPLVGCMDLKFFWIGRVGMGLWFVIAFRWFMITLLQFESLSQLFSMSMALCLTIIYIKDFYENEMWYTQTIDMIHDKFGFMMAWGSVVWMPFVYSHMMYKIWLSRDLSILNTFIFGILGIVAMIAFRFINSYRIWARQILNNRVNSNTENDSLLNLFGWFELPLAFSHYPPEGIKVYDANNSSTYLVTSGPYSLCRHPNYIADLVWAFSLCSLAECFTGYLFFVFMLCLLTNRCIRDENRCANKYKEGWNLYCVAVPWHLIPNLF